MTGQEILNQDEIDALLHGVDSGAVSTDAPAAPGEARGYDFAENVRIVRGKMPTLEMINERFGRLFRVTLYNFLRRSAVISVGSVHVLKYAEYVRTLQLPTSLNLVKFNPLRGTGLVLLEPKLVFALVDMFFGGKGRHAKIEGREFTTIESHIIRSVVDGVFENLREAWSHVIELSLEHVGSEMNPHFANIVSPTEIVVVTRFGIEIDGGGGDLHLTMPYSMIEPLREVLDSGVQSDRVEKDDRWSLAMRQELESAQIEMRAVLGEETLTVEELVALRPGDVVSFGFEGCVTLLAEDVPILRGAFGKSRGQLAVKVNERVCVPKADGLEKRAAAALGGR